MTPSRKNDDWFSVTSSDPEILQGDLLDGFLAPFPKTIKQQNSKISCDYVFLEMDAVVITQSCDVSEETVQDDDQVVLCPRYFLANVYRSKTQLKDDWKKFVKDQIIDKLLLNKFEDESLGFGYSFVDFSKVYVVPYKYASDSAVSLGRRVRMKSPYRERLSQAFARKYMRVGLPDELTKDVPDLKFSPVSAYDQESN